MDLRDLIKLAGIVNPEVLNRIQPTAPEADCGCSMEEAEGAGFERATTEPEEEIYDDPLASMGSTVDLSLRRYLKAKGDHVTVDEAVYPDYTVEDVSVAYTAFKESKERQYVCVHAKKGKYECTAGSSYEAAKKAAEKWGMKSTAGIDVHLADKEKVATEAKDYGPGKIGAIQKMLDKERDAKKEKIDQPAGITLSDWKAIAARKEELMDAGMEPEEAQDQAAEEMGIDPEELVDWLDANDDLYEAEEGTYMKQWYNYSEDFAMLELYVDGKLVDSWSDYFGANETGNPLQAKFIEMAKENGIDPVGLKVVDGSDGDEGVFTSNGIKWNSNEVAESLNDIRKLAGIAKELIDEGKMSDQIIRDSETMSKEEFTKKYGKEMADEYFESVANEGRFKDMYIELEDLEPAIMHLKTKYMDQGMEPEEAQDMACETLGCDPEMFDEYLTMKFNESTLDEAEIELAPGYTIKTDNPGIYKGTKTTSGFVGGQSGEAMYMANRVLDAIEEQDPSSSEEVFALARKFCKEMGCTDDAKKRVYKQLAKMGWTESLEEADIDENAFNQAAAAAARANKDSFEFNGKTYKTKMDKSTAHKLDDDVEMLRKLAGLV